MESGLAARNGGRAGLVALVAILLLGLGLRVGEAWDGRAPVYDARAYAAIAANLSEGEGFTVGPQATQPSSNYSPGLPLFVAGLYEVTGGVHEQFARVMLALVGALSVLFAYLIGRRLWSPWAGIVAAAAVAIYPALLEYQGMLMGEPLAATLLAGGVLALLWAWDGGWVRWLLPGALFATLALVRPEYLAVGILVAAVVFAREAGRDWRHSLLRAGIFLGALVVVIAPWTIRNAVALDRFVPISTGGGQVLFAGTYLPSDGDPEKVGAEVVAENPDLFQSQDAERLRMEQILARLAADRYPGMETDQALSKLGKKQLWDDLSEEPLEYAGFVATKVWRIWAHGPRDVMREPGWEIFHWALVAFGLLGLAVLAWRRRWEALLLGTIFLAITAVSALLVASPRRVLVLIPLVAPLAGVGCAWLSSSLSRP
ncbi:MAG TPA: glycosyltransferase family 39 protein [Solirubrobacterales bacterium]|jgi:4-amino-4-deoxy-L-arabinose transferase-like glycosyltransferase